MIELLNDSLIFTFPKINPKAKLTIRFKRTLRIPDDDTNYPLPPGIGNFPLRHVDDYYQKVPQKWIARGGVILPMYQSEALWIDFTSSFIFEHSVEYPFAVKVATGKINAVSGDAWQEGLNSNPQDYVVVPEQPWIDGYCVEKNIIRQFVGMPLGSGYSVEEQVTDEAEYGGVQIKVYPMKREVFEKRFPKVKDEKDYDLREQQVMYCFIGKDQISLAPGGRMRQEIYEDPYDLTSWDVENTSRCFVHLLNSLTWKKITGEIPPTWLPTAKEYDEACLPWVEYYREPKEIEEKTSRRPQPKSNQWTGLKYEEDDEKFLGYGASNKSGALSGSALLKKIKSVIKMGKQKGENPLPENKSTKPKNIIKLKGKHKSNVVREEDF